MLEPGERLLLGTDLVKDPARAGAAPTTTRPGVTAEFNRNVLRVLNRELGADFDVDAFDARRAVGRRARVDRDAPARRSCDAGTRAGADLTVDFAAGEEMRTEVSAKFRRAGVERELTEAGFALRRWWTDPESRFAECLAEVAPPM